MTNEDNDNIARQIYLEVRGYKTNDMLDVIEQRKVNISNIKADMALFRHKNLENNTVLTYYYNRIEVRQGNQLEVVPLNFAGINIGK